MARNWVLVVEDEPNVREMLVEWLETSGFKTTFAEDAMQAFIQARDLKPILILCDLMMPIWGSGADAYKQLRGAPETKDIPVIFVTGADPVLAEKMVPDEPKVRLLFKPVQWPLLALTIKELTGIDVEKRAA
jgi:CheY-like chemotaxis protein